jgi:phosphoglycolate phosphatase
MLFPMSIELGSVNLLIFDFDYTLVDSSPVIIEGVSYALGKMGLAIPAPEILVKTIGRSSKDALKELLGTRNRDIIKEFQDLVTYRENEVIFEKTALVDGAEQTLKKLKRSGLRMGIVSNQYRHRIEVFLSREKLIDLFDAIVGVEDAPKSKPDPSGLLMALNKLNGLKTETVYVGDSPVDAETARRIKMPFIAILTGTTSERDFKKYSPCSFINSLLELPQLLDKRQ